MSKQFVVELVENKNGEYPPIDLVKHDYISYFENEYGEQLIFVYLKRDATATLYHSDCNWEAYNVTDGKAPEIVLDMQEQLWLAGCWWAATTNAPSWWKVSA